MERWLSFCFQGLKEIEELLKFAAEKNVKPWVNTYKMSDINKALEDFIDEKTRFGFVLEN